MNRYTEPHRESAALITIDVQRDFSLPGALWGGKMSSAVFSLRRYPLIFVVKTAQNQPGDDLASRWRAGPSRRPRRSLQVQCTMRPCTIVVPHVLPQDTPQMSLIDDDDVVQALPP